MIHRAMLARQKLSMAEVRMSMLY